MIKEISSVTNSLIKELSSLSIKKMKEDNLLIIEGKDLVDEAYLSKSLKYILCLKEEQDYKDIDQYIVKDYILEKLSKNKSVPSIIGVASLPTNHKLGNKLVYLDGVQDPGNVGTIIRTALALDYDGVILSSDSASIYNSKTIQASKGALFKLPIYTKLELIDLKKDYELIATSLKESLDYKEFKPKEKFIIILGSEGQGIKKETEEISNIRVKIRINNIDSLNVAIAGALLMEEYR